MKAKPKHGGARAGAGRPTTELKSSSITLRLSPEVLGKLREEAERVRLSLSEYLRALLASQVKIIGWRGKSDGPSR